MANEIRSLFIPGPAGRLEALLNAGSNAATYAALVCHPHPMFGGTMHNKVVFNTMKALNGCGFPVLRFNFRGAGLSQGKHDDGRGEVEDVRAALDWLDGESHLPMVFAGFSFGAGVGLRAACPDARVAAMIALGLPIAAAGREYDYAFLGQCAKPKLFISGTQDEFCPRAELERVTAGAANPKDLVFIESAGHFFEGRLGEVQGKIEEWVRKTL
ncbi:MAG: alpha/beta hydrolase [Terriglobales bacterium]